MSTLNDILAQAGTRPQVVADCEKVIEEEVDSKGILAAPIKLGYKAVKAVKPGFVPEVIDHMLDDFAGKLDPLYQQAKSKNEPITAYFNSRPGEVAEALLSITDERAQRAKNQTLKSLYGSLRGTAKKHVEAAVPRIARLVDKYDKAAPATAPSPSA